MQRADATDGKAPSGDGENQLIEWCSAVETAISFEQATTLSGAAIQLALAIDTVRLVGDPGAETCEQRLDAIALRVERLVRSAMRAMAIRDTMSEDVAALSQTYASFFGGAAFNGLVHEWAKTPEEHREQA